MGVKCKNEQVGQNEQIQYYDIVDFLYKGINGQYNLIIYDHPFCKKNTKSFHITDTLNKKNNVLHGKKYCICVGSGLLYEGVLSHDNIFPVNDIPFGMLIYHCVMIIVYDVPYMTNYQFKIEFFESDINNQNDYCEIHWPAYHPNNSLRFMGGMCGIAYHDDIIYDENYLNDHKTTITLPNNLTHLNVTYLDENNKYFDNAFLNCEEYSISKILIVLVSNKINNKYFDIVSETLKIPTKINKNIATYTMYGGFDGIGNVFVLIDGMNNSMNNSINDSGNTIKSMKFSHLQIMNNNGELSSDEYICQDIIPNNNGYIIGDFSNNYCANALGKKLIEIEIEFNKDIVNNVWLKFDRQCYSSSLRNHVAQKILSFRFNLETIQLYIPVNTFVYNQIMPSNMSEIDNKFPSLFQLLP
jgi:hypothetical protein